MIEPDDLRLSSSDAIAGAKRRGRVRRLPRFGLRTLLLLAVACSLLFGWIGRNAMRMRKEEAAFEAFQQAGGNFYMHGGDESYAHWPRDFVGYRDAAGRLLGWKRGPRIQRVLLNSVHRRDELVLARALDSLATFPEIERVDLLGQDVTDESLVALTRLSKLESVHLGNTSVTSAGIERLGPPLRIREFSVVRFRSDERIDIETLVALKDLRSVSVDDGTISREDVAALASLPELEELRLCRVLPEAADVYAPLAGAKKLRFLHLTAAGCSDVHMATIAKLPALEELYVEGITDAGLATLESAPALRLVALRSPVTHEAVTYRSLQHPDRLVFYFDDRTRSWTYFRGGASIEPSDLPEDLRRKFGFW